MLKINVTTLYYIGVAFADLRGFKADLKYRDAANLLNWVHDAIDSLLNGNVYKFKSSLQAGRNFLSLIDHHKGIAFEQFASSPAGDLELGWGATQIATAVNQYETLFAAEVGVADTYLVLSKGGFDTTQLVENGISMFPSQLPIKVPDAVADCNAAARCIAFELPTAAGFHLHRANEAVLKRYYDAVTKGAARPESRTVGGYLNQLEKLKAGDPKVIEALKSIKDLHRNPVVHPEHSLEDAEEALALYGLVNTVMVHMLKAIPVAAP